MFSSESELSAVTSYVSDELGSSVHVEETKSVTYTEYSLTGTVKEGK